MAEFLTPYVCSSNGYSVTVWCGQCRVGRLFRCLGGSWRWHWHREIANIWKDPGLKCEQCGAPAVRLDVQRRVGGTGQFETLFPSSNIWARGFFPASVYTGGLAGDVYLNLRSEANSLASYEPGSAGFALLLHELGHTLGLKHPHDDGGTGRPTLTGLGVPGLDIDWFSVMSYADDANWNRLSWDPGTFMVMDVLALQYLYGKNLSTNAGDTTFGLTLDGTYKSIWDASGNDTVSAAASPVGWSIHLPYLTLSALVDTKAGAALPTAELQFTAPENLRWLLGDIENLIGSAFDDTLLGNDQNNVISGGAGSDAIDGGGGADILTGGAGPDGIIGGDGVDTAVYSGPSTSYSWTRQADGLWKVVDNRAGNPDGIDFVDVELLRFTDKTVTLSASLTSALQTAFTNILRSASSAAGNATLADDIAGRMAAGTLSQSAAVALLVQQADTTTSVASLAYQFFTGRIPSAAGMDFLVSPTGPNANNLNSAYYQSFNLENRYINVSVNLGKNGEGKAAFEAAYGTKTLIDAAKSAYTTIFGSAPTDAKVHLLIDSRVDYFAFYGQDGPNGIGTKAAMVGWLLAEAVKADIGTLQTANMAFLTDLADGANFAVDLVGVYHGTPYLG